MLHAVEMEELVQAAAALLARCLSLEFPRTVQMKNNINHLLDNDRELEQ